MIHSKNNYDNNHEDNDNKDNEDYQHDNDCKTNRTHGTNKRMVVITTKYYKDNSRYRDNHDGSHDNNTYDTDTNNDINDDNYDLDNNYDILRQKNKELCLMNSISVFPFICKTNT